MNLTDQLHDAAFLNHGNSSSWKSPAESKHEEAAFFSQLVSLFANDPDLPLEQLKSFPCATITEYLCKAHNNYLNKRLPEIEQHLIQLANHPGELSETLATVFAWLQKNMEKHFRIEEQSLFPYIVDLAQAKNGLISREDVKLKYKDFTVARFMETHHDDVENKLAEIKKHIVRSLTSLEALFPYRVLLQKLDNLERDLRIHARIEDEVLVPLALEWEKA